MKQVQLRLLGLKVRSFSPLENTVELEITFDDGNLKQVYKTIVLEDSKAAAESILADLVKMERGINVEFDGETLISNSNIYLEDLGKNLKELIIFLNNLHSRMLQIRHKKDAEGYMSLVNDINRMELRLDEQG